MKTIRLLAAILFLISGIFHVYLAYKGDAKNSQAFLLGDGILYLVLGILLLLKKRFPFWLGLITLIVSFITPHMLPEYKDWVNAMHYIELVAIICCAIVLLSWKRDTQPFKGFRWTVRVFSGLIIAFAVFMFIGETFFGENPGNPLSTSAIIGLSIFGIGMIGLGLAWKWELTGGILSLVSFFGLVISEPSVLLPTPLLIWPLAAILFIVLWATNRNIPVKNY